MNRFVYLKLTSVLTLTLCILQLYYCQHQILLSAKVDRRSKREKRKRKKNERHTCVRLLILFFSFFLFSISFHHHLRYAVYRLVRGRKRSDAKLITYEQNGSRPQTRKAFFSLFSTQVE